MWIFDENNKTIVGYGVNAFLISRHSYGYNEFEIQAKISYSNIKLDFSPSFYLYAVINYSITVYYFRQVFHTFRLQWRSIRSCSILLSSLLIFRSSSSGQVFRARSFISLNSLKSYWYLIAAVFGNTMFRDLLNCVIVLIA